MAEGGDFPMEPMDPDRGEGDDHRDDKDEETSFGGDDLDTRHRGGGASGSTHHENPGFEPDEETTPLIDPLEQLDRKKEEAERALKAIFVDPRLDSVLYGIDDYERVWVSLQGRKSVRYVHQPSGRFLNQSGKEMPKTLKQVLGETNEEALTRNDQIIEQNEEDLTRLRASPDMERRAQLERENQSLADQGTRFGVNVRDEIERLSREQREAGTREERDRISREIADLARQHDQMRERDQATMQRNNEEIERLREQTRGSEEQIQRLETENERLGEQNEQLFENMSLRDKVKYIFKKYGFSVIGVVAAVGTVIGVIVSNLKAGLSNVAKGVGNGLKELGKKLGQILPGMVGAIVSFLFKTAGEAVGFLAKHAWLLILLVVTFVIEQFKKRR